jgi:hypothetical protein
LATSTIERAFIEAVAEEMASGIDAALEHWLGKIDCVLRSPELTTLGRLEGVREILVQYKKLAGKAELPSRF